jgi:hypothetical protein
MKSRLDELFQYLNLLCEVNDCAMVKPYTVGSKILRTCEEIEKELGIGEKTKEYCDSGEGETTDKANKLAEGFYNAASRAGRTPLI